MVDLASLLLPIILSAVLVFLASSLIHTVLGYHRNDYRQHPAEPAIRSALQGPPGDYVIPYAASMEAMKSPEHRQKLQEGPIAFITVAPPGSWSMGGSLAAWFGYCLVVSVFAAYIAGRALEPGVSYLEVFRFAGATAFAGYGLGIWQQTIWYRRGAASSLKSTLDALIYALLTAGVFGWLWPAA
jgi:hypothetical protein